MASTALLCSGLVVAVGRRQPGINFRVAFLRTVGEAPRASNSSVNYSTNNAPYVDLKDLYEDMHMGEPTAALIPESAKVKEKGA